MAAEEAYLEFIEHIVEWGDRIPSLIGDRTYDQFVEDAAIHLAVWKCVEVIGEAAGRALQIEPGLARHHEALALRQAYAMRNRLTHGYADVDLFILWNTARDFVPALVDAARELLARRER